MATANVIGVPLCPNQDSAYITHWQFHIFLTFYIFRWFKFTLKPPYTVAIGNFFSAIWDTFLWHYFVKFGLKTAWDIS